MKRKVVLCTVAAVALVGIWAALVMRAKGRLPYLPRHWGPEYGWLVFSPQARVRILARIDGEAVTLEHYDGDTPTGRTERFERLSDCKDLTIRDPDGKTSYIIHFLDVHAARDGGPACFRADVSIKGPVEYRQYCGILLKGNDPSSADLAHFHGPLKVQVETTDGKAPSNLALRRGDKPTTLRAYVGTMDADRGCWVPVYCHDIGVGPKTGFPPGVHPFVDVEFPAGAPGDPPIRRRYPLEKRC